MVCSNSLVFEPEEMRKPLIRFYLRYMPDVPSTLELQPRGAPKLKAEAASRTLGFKCWRHAEMKPSGIIGPYKVVGGNKPQPADTLALHCVSFVHTEPSDALPLIEKLFRIAKQAAEGPARLGRELLR